MTKKKLWKRIRNPLIPALIKRRPKTKFIDKKKQKNKNKCREKNLD